MKLILTCACLGVLLTYVTAQPCIEAQECIDRFVNNAKVDGIEQEEFCEYVRDALECLEDNKEYCLLPKQRQWVQDEIRTQTKEYPECGSASIRVSLVGCLILAVIALLHQ